MSHYDAIIVGSGFGGSVMAYRLAEAGQRVCVLERGRPYPPGSFTRSPRRARESFWDPERGLTGMYHYWSFRGIDALVSAGLGGGSLIYANVLLRKDERWFVHEEPRSGRARPCQTICRTKGTAGPISQGPHGAVDHRSVDRI
jgi:cholesterol oxidase